MPVMASNVLPPVAAETYVINMTLGSVITSNPTNRTKTGIWRVKTVMRAAHQRRAHRHCRPMGPMGSMISRAGGEICSGALWGGCTVTILALLAVRQKRISTSLVVSFCTICSLDLALFSSRNHSYKRSAFLTTSALLFAALMSLIAKMRRYASWEKSNWTRRRPSSVTGGESSF